MSLPKEFLIIYGGWFDKHILQSDLNSICAADLSLYLRKYIKYAPISLLLYFSNTIYLRWNIGLKITDLHLVNFHGQMLCSLPSLCPHPANMQTKKRSNLFFLSFLHCLRTSICLVLQPSLYLREHVLKIICIIQSQKKVWIFEGHYWRLPHNLQCKHPSTVATIAAKNANNGFKKEKKKRSTI